MLNDTETETEAPPPGSWTPAQIRRLKIAIAVMSVLLVAGFILLFVGIYLQSQKLAKQPEPSPLTPPVGVYGPIALPVRAGTEVSQVFVDQGRLILHLRRQGGSEIAIIDLSSGRETQRVRLIPQE